MASVGRRRIRQRAEPKPIAESPAAVALFSRQTRPEGRDALGLLNCSITEAGDDRSTSMSLMLCSCGPLEAKTFRGRKPEWAAQERSPPRFSAERPKSCGV